MSRICFIVVLMLISASSAAQQQSHIDAATELLEAKHSEKSLQQTYERLLSQISETRAQMDVTEERRQRTERYMEEMLVVAKEVMS